MTEGELKKRKVYVFEEEWSDEPIEGTNQREMVFFSDVDEAKKEFPVIVYENGEGTISSRIAIEWFLKWFGDSS